jgi:hypothetical protein
MILPTNADAQRGLHRCRNVVTNTPSIQPGQPSNPRQADPRRPMAPGGHISRLSFHAQVWPIAGLAGKEAILVGDSLSGGFMVGLIARSREKSEEGVRDTGSAVREPGE